MAGIGPSLIAAASARRCLSVRIGAVPANTADQAVGPMRVQLYNPVAHDLHGATADGRSLAAGRTVVYRGQGEKTSGLIGISASAGGKP